MNLYEGPGLCLPSAKLEALVSDLRYGTSIKCSYEGTRPTSGIVPSFLQMAVASPKARAELMRRAATSAGQYNISARTHGTLAVPLPPFDEQKRIVAEVDRQFSIIDSMAKAIDAGLQRAGTLRPSILSQAFSGKLTGAA